MVRNRRGDPRYRWERVRPWRRGHINEVKNGGTPDNRTPTKLLSLLILLPYQFKISLLNYIYSHKFTLNKQEMLRTDSNSYDMYSPHQM